MLKDEDYFDYKIFFSTNSRLHKKLKSMAVKKKQPIYLIVDEALRLYVEKENNEELPRPKIPTLV